MALRHGRLSRPAGELGPSRELPEGLSSVSQYKAQVKVVPVRPGLTFVLGQGKRVEDAVNVPAQETLGRGISRLIEPTGDIERADELLCDLRSQTVWVRVAAP